MPEIENVSRPPETLIFNPTPEECKAVGLPVEEKELILYTEDADGNRKEKIINKVIPSAIRLLPGEIKEVSDAFLELPKVKRAVLRNKIRIKTKVKVESRKSRKRAELKNVNETPSDG